MSVAEENGVADDPGKVSWKELRQQIERRAAARNLATLWPECGDDGAALRWGVAVAYAGAVPPVVGALAKIAAGRRPPRGFDIGDAADRFVDSLSQPTLPVEHLAEAVAWSYGLAELAMLQPAKLSEHQWWTVLGELQALHRASLEQAGTEAIERLLAGGEIGAVLGWRLADLPSCAALREPAHQAILDWHDSGSDTLAAALADGGRWARLTLGSVLRSRRLAARQNRQVAAKRSEAVQPLAVWVAALTRPDGSCSLQTSQPQRRAVRAKVPQKTVYADDVSRDGLLAIAAVEVGAAELRTATDAILGRTKSNGRLAWKVELPEPGWCDETAQLAVMLPEWDVRRGRVAIDYSRPAPRIEISGGKQLLVAGDWTAELLRDGRSLQPTSKWTDVCWYTDDDVHYLELEQRFEEGLKIQRQIMLLREDECLMLADAVIGGEDDQPLEYVGHLPLVPTANALEEPETRELTIVDGKPRAMVLPLGLNEWRVGPSAGTFRAIDEVADGSDAQQSDGRQSDGGQSDGGLGLRLETRLRGNGRLYAALWFDFDRKRFRRDRTWRQLTVAQKLRLLGPHEAAGYRIHVGDDQWLVYRSLTGQQNRTVLGKNLISDFFCGRFDASDGFVEELIAVDEQPS